MEAEVSYTAFELLNELTKLKQQTDLKKLVVAIPNNKVGFAGTACTKVTSANRGIDWDTYRFFIRPEIEMQETAQKPVDTKEWKGKSKEFAEKQMESELGIEWNRDDPENLNKYYSFIFMFIRDCYNLYHKY